MPEAIRFQQWGESSEPLVAHPALQASGWGVRGQAALHDVCDDILSLG